MPEIRTLSDACSHIVDCAHKTAPIHESGAFFAVGTPAMRGHVINYSEARRINRETFEAWTARLKPRFGDLLLAREAPVGPVVRIPVDENVAPGQRTVLLRPREGIVDSRFLYFYLTAPLLQAELSVKASGSTVPHLNVADVRALPTPGIPTHTQQQAIAEVLGALDDKIAVNDIAVRVTARLARARYEGAVRAGSSHRIDEIARLVTRGVAPKYVGSDGLIVLNQKCVRDQWVDLRPSRMTEPLRSRADRLLVRDDVLVNSTGQGTLGRVARWNRTDQVVTVDSHITIVRFDESAVDATCAGFGVLELEAQIEALAEGSTGQTELRRDLLGALQLRLPPPQAQAELGQELRHLDALSLSLRAENEQLAATRDELLPVLMSGKVRVRGAEEAVGGPE